MATISKEQLTKTFPAWPVLLFITISVAITAWALIYLLSIEEFSSKSLPHDMRIPGNASLVLVYGDGKERVFLGRVPEGMSIYHALLASAQAGRFEIKTRFSEDGVIVEEIDGLKSTNQKKWHYYLNGEYKDMVSPRGESIKSGDRIEFRYE